MPNFQLESSFRRCLVAPPQIHYLRYLLEAYEGIAVVSTQDSRLGLVRIDIAPGCEEDVQRILEGEGENLRLQLVESTT
ncbi:MAG: DUF4911 domain-containing protein [Deltaproteobacteria bacterium]|nr:DUF4911 domain-containing protein [Deltaproteobacteria bacterium]